jgi:hypothetical protein
VKRKKNGARAFLPVSFFKSSLPHPLALLAAWRFKFEGGREDFLTAKAKERQGRGIGWKRKRRAFWLEEGRTGLSRSAGILSEP